MEGCSMLDERSPSPVRCCPEAPVLRPMESPPIRCSPLRVAGISLRLLQSSKKKQVTKGTKVMLQLKMEMEALSIGDDSGGPLTRPVAMIEPPPTNTILSSLLALNLNKMKQSGCATTRKALQKKPKKKKSKDLKTALQKRGTAVFSLN
eukprot:TRINITY_DN18571_c0_g1_i1.p2 TRINITY_DN18571_c0_g1~~TRINITY_DN18571_c0_g1_i1.p2  ORF type:complete len:149 (+),score=18.74 TRINITY_DN18571_c0_g1_i1:85-531(+)